MGKTRTKLKEKDVVRVELSLLRANVDTDKQRLKITVPQPKGANKPC